MRTIKEMMNYFECEVEDVGSYSKAAIRFKNENPDIYRAYLELAKAELQHAEKLRDLVLKHAQAIPEDQITPMIKAVWEEKVDEMSEGLVKAKTYISLAS